jgi:hypothetical protein
VAGQLYACTSASGFGGLTDGDFTEGGVVESGVVEVAALVAAVERGRVRRVQWRAEPQAFDEVGVGQRETANGDDVGESARDVADPGGQVGAAAVEQQRVRPPPPQFDEQFAVVPGDVQVGEVEWRERRDLGGVKRGHVVLNDVVERVPG